MLFTPEIAAYCSSFTFGLALYLIQLLLPLYMHSQGFSGSEIGLIVASPSFFRVVVHPLAGMVSDRIGERNVLLISFSMVMAAGIFFSKSPDFLMLLLVQMFLMGASRAFFWPTIHSFSSRVNPVKTPHILGRVASSFGAGSMVGLALSGYLVIWFGFTWAFMASAFSGAVALLMAALMPVIPRGEKILSVADAFRSLGKNARIKQLYAGTTCGFTAALPFVLISSFYPIFLENKGFTEDIVGIFSASYNVGFILLGIIVGIIAERFGFRLLASTSTLLMGAAMLVIVNFSYLPVLLMGAFILGIATAGPNMLYQEIGSLYSIPEERGGAMAISGYGFPLAFLVIPLGFGVLADLFGVENVLLIMSLIVLAEGFVIRIIFNLLNLKDFHEEYQPEDY